MEQLIPQTYSTHLVVLSYVIAAVGSYIALSATQKMRKQTGTAYTYSMLVAGIAFGGIAVWAMHFVGMLAMKIPLGLSYSVWETVLSLIAAIGAASWGLAIVAKNPKSIPRLVGAGAVLGFGVSVMHYLGMYGMRFGGFFAWDMQLVILSILIAFVAATAGLWLTFNAHSHNSRIIASVVMAVAVCAMHYTGMLAADVICTTPNRVAIPSGTGLVSVMDLPLLVITFVVGMVIALAINLLFTPKTDKGPSVIQTDPENVPASSA